MESYWHVVYFGDGILGSIQLTIDNEVFIPREVREYLKDRNDLEKVVLINWIKLDKNQLSEEALEFSDEEEE